jgi:hypothetical protein
MHRKIRDLQFSTILKPPRSVLNKRYQIARPTTIINSNLANYTMATPQNPSTTQAEVESQILYLPSSRLQTLVVHVMLALNSSKMNLRAPIPSYIAPKIMAGGKPRTAKYPTPEADRTDRSANKQPNRRKKN